MLLIRSEDTTRINFVKTWTLRFNMEIKAGLNLMRKEFREIWMNSDAHFGTEGVVVRKKKQKKLLIWVVLIDCVMVCAGWIVYESKTVVGRHPVPYFCCGGCLCSYLLDLSFGWLWFLWGSMLLALRCCLSVPRYFMISILILNSPEKRFFFLYSVPTIPELVCWWFHKLLLCRLLYIVGHLEQNLGKAIQQKNMIY